MRKHFGWFVWLLVVAFVSPAFAKGTDRQHRENGWEGEIGFSLRSFSSVSNGTLPPAYQFLNTQETEASIFTRAKYQWIAFDMSIDFGGQSVTMLTAGSSKGAIRISTPISIGVKGYPLDVIEKGLGEKLHLYPFVGLTFNYVKAVGDFSQGGYRFPTSGRDVFSPEVPIGIEFGKDVRIFLEYDVRMITLDTSIPNLGILRFQETGNLEFGGGIPFDL